MRPEKKQKNIQIQRVVSKKNGLILSGSYQNMRSRYLLRCYFGHEWETSAERLFLGRWCRKCAGTAPLSLNDAIEEAKKRGGRCLSKDYKNNQTPLLWECSIGHRWEAVLASLRNNGSWCPHCAGTVKLKIEDLKEAAHSRGGQLLSDKYINANHRYQWKCEADHVWFSSFSNIKMGKWCKRCAAEKNAAKTRHSIDDIIKAIQEKNGICRSSEYKNWESKIDVECHRGHKWTTRAGTLLKGQWCPECSYGRSGTQGLSERICRLYFEGIFGRRFPQSRPSWLLNERGKQMHLDGYCEELGLAFEHHGIQHYERVNFFHGKRGGDISLKTRQRDDNHKEKLCRENKVLLIIVPALDHLLPKDELFNFIREKCINLDADFPESAKEENIDLSSLYFDNPIGEIAAIVSQMGGTLLSKDYIRTKTKMKIVCHSGHEFRMAPAQLRLGHWCFECSKRKMGAYHKSRIADIHLLAKKMGGSCLSKEYESHKQKLEWQCAQGHSWKAHLTKIKAGNWCPECGKKKSALNRRISIAELEKLLLKHGANIVETNLSAAEYSNTIYVVARCRFGHEWKTSLASIRAGSGCVICSKRVKLTEEMLREITKLKEGSVLSFTGLRNSDFAKLICKKDHTWTTKIGNLRAGHWCPDCGRDKTKNSHRHSISEMNSRAQEFGGNCISETYVSAKEPLQWVCAQGHKFELQPQYVKKGRWCPSCGKKTRKAK